ncbi:MAG: helix-turn-helix transcriptional regulator [Bacteroidales bacterium]|nr:helix-turn-helix transcriptional regulator [Bacteroidales bacterium]
MKKNKENVVQRIRDRIKPENRIFVQKNLQICNQITCILKNNNWSQKEFANQLGKNESEVSKMLSGLHNLTLQSITKMEAVLEEEIIITPIFASEKYKQYTYIAYNSNKNCKKIESGYSQKQISINENLKIKNQSYQKAV